MCEPCFPKKGSKVGKRIVLVYLIPEYHKSSSVLFGQFKYADQEHYTSMDSDLNFLKNPIYWLCQSISKVTSKLIMKSHFQRYQFSRWPNPASSESCSLNYTFTLQLFENRIKLRLFHLSATSNHRPWHIAARRFQFPQNSVSLALSEIYQRGPSLDVGNQPFSLITIEWLTSLEYITPFIMINYRSNHTDS